MKFPPSALLERNSLLFGWAQLAITIQFCFKFFIVPQCHKINHLKRVFSSTNLPFRKNKPKPNKNLKFPPSGLLERNSLIFGRAQLATTIQFWLKFFIVPQCHKTKLLKRVFSSTNLPLKKNKPKPKKTWNFHLLSSFNKIHQFSAWLNEKPEFSFDQNFP